MNSPRGYGSFLQLPDDRWLWAAPDSPAPGSSRLAYSTTTDGTTFTPWRYLGPTGISDWIYSALYSGEPSTPRQVTGEGAWLQFVEADPVDRWGTNQILRVPITPGL